MITIKDIQKIVGNSTKAITKDLKKEIIASANKLREELKAEIVSSAKSLREEIGSSAKSLREEFKDDIETAVAQVIEAVIKHTASKEDLKRVEDRLANVEIGVIDVKRSINDLKADTPTPQEFADHEKRITKLEVSAFPQ